MSTAEVLRSERSSAKWRAYDADVLPLWIAEMDYPLAGPIAAALTEAVRRSDTGYRWSGSLAEDLADFAERRLDWHVHPERVIVLADVLTGMAESLRALTAPGDSVVVTPPVYPPFFGVTRGITGREIVEVALHADGSLNVPGLIAAFARPDVTAFLLCNPHNPTGTIPDHEGLVAIAQAARAHGVTVISDEIWSPVVLGATRVTPYLSLGDDLTGPDVALVSASKAFNLAGLKCAQIVAGSGETARALRERIPVEVTYGTGHFGVIASSAAYRDGDAWLDETVAAIGANARLLGDLLAEHLPQVDYREPAATYLAWLDMRGLGLGDDPAAAVLERTRVALNPGPSFGAPGIGHARLNLATDPGLLEEAVVRMSSLRT